MHILKTLKFKKYCHENLEKVLILELRKCYESFKNGTEKSFFLYRNVTGGKLYTQFMNLLITECTRKMHISLQYKS